MKTTSSNNLTERMMDSPLGQTLRSCQQNLQAQPEDVTALQSYAETLMALGDVAQGAVLFKQALERQPHRPELNYGWLWNLHYLPGYDRRFFYEQYVKWAAQVFDEIPQPHHPNTPIKDRPIRLGIVSGSFCDNSVMSPFELVFERLDRSNFEVFGYGHVAQPDGATHRWQALCSRYRDIYEASNEQVAEWVREDGIDILFEVGGYCRGSRLGVFAYKPAPLQVDFGALSTLGMPQMDYHFTHSLLDPPGSQEFYLERLQNMNPLWPFVPPHCCPEVADLSDLQRPFTFGCFNNNRKITADMLGLWCEILTRVPNAQLVFKTPQGHDPALQAFYRETFTQQGIDAERLSFEGHCPLVEHLNRVSQCDLLLDSFPYNAARGTLEALWMGVPTLTYTGEVPVSRVGLMIMQPLGLEAFVARSDREYVDKAVSFSSQRPSLQTVRQSLRGLMRNNSLCDVTGWTRQFEQALRQMWQRWCDEASPVTSSLDPAIDAQPPLGANVFELIFSKDSPIRYRINRQGLPPGLFKALEVSEQGDTEAARQCLTDDVVDQVEQLLQREPQRADAAFLLALTLRRTEQHPRARVWYERANALSPHPCVFFELATLERDCGNLTGAIAILQQGLQATPNGSELKSSLADYLMKAGRTQEGLSLLREVIEQTPDKVNGSKYLWHQHQQEDLDEASLFAQHRQWAERYTPMSLARSSHERERDPHRRLRIGYVSGDFCSHSVAYFLEPLLDAHDPTQVETWGYGNVPHQDLVTERLKGKFHHYRNICGVADQQVISWMQEDRLDILVDLSGHTGENRLAVLAHKPAPIQVSYLGYPDTTGMEQVDYRFTDHWADRPEAQDYYSETLVHLESGFICYGPPGFAPPVKELPALHQGHVTLGSFNNSYKINDKVVGLWSEVLKAVPQSRLLLKFGGGDDTGVRRTFQQRFAACGIDSERLEIIGRVPVVEHLNLYNRVDLALDTYPYHGTTTTCESLWMGVPVLSLVGQHHVSRVGLSLLSRVGLEIFAAHHEREWVDKAVAFAGQLDDLAQIRQGLRGQMYHSSLCDKQAYARQVEQAYRQMWQKWINDDRSPNPNCGGQS